MTSPDEELLARFEAWYKREALRLFNYVSYRVPDKATAEELTAVICERALTRLHQYDPDRGVLDAWMFGIARNEVRNYYRSASQTSELMALDALPEVQAKDHSPEEICEMAETFKQIIHHLQRLPDVEQEVVALRYGAGLTNTEIAQVTGLTTNYVNVAIHRALRKLRQVILSGEGV